MTIERSRNFVFDHYGGHSLIIIHAGTVPRVLHDSRGSASSGH